LRIGVRLRRALACLVVAGGVAVLASGCGDDSKGSAAELPPTVSLWTITPQSDFRQVNDGAKLALSQAHGRAGKFRINYSAREVSDDEPQGTTDALAAARMTLQDTQSSAMLTSLADAPARQAITLLNEAGIGTVALGDGALKTAVCSPASNFYPNGRATAIVVDPDATVPAAWGELFQKTYGIAPTDKAYRAYLGAQAYLHALAAPGVATTDSPPRLNRDGLAAALVSAARGACG
jgi:hypothetical protein